jgi:ATP-dependent protease Clp ATPase subunit
LKVVEGGVYNIKINPTQSVALDTSGILWIAMGVFDGIKKDSDGRINHAALVEHGMTPEMAGRFPDICVYNATDQGMLKKILMESESSPIKQAIQFLGGDAYRVNLAFEDSAYDLIAEKALKHGNGARSLNSVVNHLLSHIINDAHDYYGKSVTLTGRKVSILLEDLPAYDPSEREAPPSHMYT